MLNQELKLIQKTNIFKSSQEKYDFLLFFLIEPRKKRLIDLRNGREKEKHKNAKQRAARGVSSHNLPKNVRIG